MDSIQQANLPLTMTMIDKMHAVIDCYEITATAEIAAPILWNHELFEEYMQRLSENPNIYGSCTRLKVSLIEGENSLPSGNTQYYTKCLVEFVN